MSMRTASDRDYTSADDDNAFFSEAPTSVDDSFSVVDRHSAFDGTFRAERDLRVEGEVKGTIECQGTLFVAQGAHVTAKVEAENISVAGDLNGDIHCRGRLQMMPSGRVRGKVSTTTLVVEEGAYYEGELEMVQPDERDQRSPRSLPSGTATPAPAVRTTADTRGAEGRPGSTTFIRRLGSPEKAWDTANEPTAGPRVEGDEGDRDASGAEVTSPTPTEE